MRWLHLSDIHYRSDSYDAGRVRSRLVEYLKAQGELDFVLFTGDAMFRHELDPDCGPFLSRLIRECGAKGCKMFMCPGNHDVSREDASRRSIIKQVIERGGTLSREDVDELSRDGYEEYAGLYRQLAKREYDHFRVLRGIARSEEYRVVELDSTLLSHGDSDKGNLRIMSDRLEDLEGSLADDGCINIAIMHHGVEFLKEEEQKKLQHWFDDAHVDVVFCGHAHHVSVTTYDDTSRAVKQLTVGSAQYINYDIPTVQLCEYDATTCMLKVSLAAYYPEIDDWAAGASIRRAFRNGTLATVLERPYGKATRASAGRHVSAVSVASDCGVLFDRLRTRYVEAFGENIFSVRSGESIPFSIDKLMRSVLDVGMPVPAALEAVNRGVENLVNDRTRLQNETMSTGILRDYIYRSICVTPTDTGVTPSALQSWSSRYARRYGQNDLRFAVIRDGRRESLSYAFVRDDLLRGLIREAVDCDKPEEVFSSKEKSDMATEVVSLVDEFDCLEMSFETLRDVVREVIHGAPHPWFCCSEERCSVLRYNLEKLGKHLGEIEAGNAPGNMYLEIVYHASAVLLLCGGTVVGNRDLSPFRMLYEGVYRESPSVRGRYLRRAAARAMEIADGLDEDLWLTVKGEIRQVEEMLAKDRDPTSGKNSEVLKAFGAHAELIGKRCLDLEGNSEGAEGAGQLIEYDGNGDHDAS